MAEDQADWSTDSNNAVHMSLVTPGVGGPRTLHTFNPKMTYSIFGDEETIFGYQGLKINLRYNACDMRPGLQITYSKKFKTVGETAAADLKAILEQYVPKTAFEKTAVFDSAISEPQYADWKPPGELWKSIAAGGQTYEIWKGSLVDLAVQQMVKRVQIFIPFFIEGGTFIDLSEPEWSLERWTIFFLYQKKTVDSTAAISPYVFMGYSTVYRYFLYQPVAGPPSPSPTKQAINRPANLNFEFPLPETSFSSLPCRSRISQFVILPPFQQGGNGSRFYNAIFDFYLQQPQAIEITVEDPNEAFDDLRDLNDLARLRADPEFTALRINTKVVPRAKGAVPKDIVDMNALEKIRTKYKIAPRQFYRVVEMQLLSLTPAGVRQSLLVEQENSKKTVPNLKAREHEYYLWQLWVKKRLYKHNKDTLIQLDRVERIEKLEEALGGVEADYARLLRALESRSKLNNGGANGSGTASNGKRSSPDEAEGGEPAAKKVKFTA